MKRVLLLVGSILVVLFVIATITLRARKGGLVGYWTFDTAAIKNAKVIDQSGHELNGTLQGGVNSTAGVINQGLSFDGRSGFIQFPDDKLTALGSNITLALWLKTENKSRTEAILSRYDAGGMETGYLLRTNSTGHLELRIGGNNSTLGAGITVMDADKPVNDGQWHHVAIVIALGQGVSFYVDGAPSSSQTLNIVAHPTKGSLMIGLNGWQELGTYFTGSLDDVRIYNSVVLPSKIAALARFPAGGNRSLLTLPAGLEARL